MTDVFNAIWSIMVGIKEEKRSETDEVNFYQSLQDGKIPNATRQLLKSLSEMGFECLGRGELIISSETLNEYHLDASSIYHLDQRLMEALFIIYSWNIVLASTLLKMKKP